MAKSKSIRFCLHAIAFALALAVVQVGCAGMPKVTPHILDTQLNELREYEVADPQKLTIRFKKEHPLPRTKDGYGNGFFCAPQEEVAEFRDWCLQRKCTEQGWHPMQSLMSGELVVETEERITEEQRSINTMQEWVLP